MGRAEWREAHTIRGHSHVIHAVSFSPDGLTLASASQDGTVRLWDVISGKEKSGSPLALPDGATAVTFSSDGKYLAAGSFDGGCWIWSIDSLELVRQFEGTKAPVFGLAFTPDTSTLIASAHDGIVYRPRLMIWDVASGRAREVKDPEEVYGPAFALSPDGSSILIPQTKRFMIRGTHDGAIHAYSGWCEGRVRGLAFDGTGSKVASCGDDGAIRIWNRGQLGKESFHLFGHEGRVTTVAFSPTDNRLVSGGSDGKVKIWDLRRTAPEISDVPMTWLLWGYRFASVAFTPDSEHLTIIHSRWPCVGCRHRYSHAEQLPQTRHAVCPRIATGHCGIFT